jgi:hypothetical protein
MDRKPPSKIPPELSVSSSNLAKSIFFFIFFVFKS